MTPSTDLQLKTADLKKAARTFRAINHPLRQSILRYLHQKGKVNVSLIYIHFQLEQSVASQHLAILRNAGFVTTQRIGRHILYSVNYDQLKKIDELSTNLLKTDITNSMTQPY